MKTEVRLSAAARRNASAAVAALLLHAAALAVLSSYRSPPSAAELRAFDVELVELRRSEPAREAEPDVAAGPTEALARPRAAAVSPTVRPETVLPVAPAPGPAPPMLQDAVRRALSGAAGCDPATIERLSPKARAVCARKLLQAGIESGALGPKARDAEYAAELEATGRARLASWEAARRQGSVPPGTMTSVDCTGGNLGAGCTKDTVWQLVGKKD